MTNKSLFQLSVSFFTVMLLAASCTSEDGPTTEADTAAINTIWSTYVSSLEAGDIDAWLSLWTEDGVQMPPNEAPVIGKDQLRQRNGAAFNLDTAVSKRTPTLCLGVNLKIGFSAHTH